MKIFVLLIAIITSIATPSIAQRYAVVDTKYILEKLPEYRQADKRMQQLADMWQKEVDEKQIELNKMQKEFDAEKFMLTDDVKKRKESRLSHYEEELHDLEKKRFGYDGDLYKERQKIIKPIQDKVYDAIQKIAIEKEYDFILDKSEGITVIFADPKLDKNAEVLRTLGIKP